MILEKNIRHVVCLILIIGYLTPVIAVTDEELDALEKQIEQQEAEEKKQVEAEKKMKADEEAKHKAEAKKKMEAKQKSIVKTAVEKKRLADLEKKKKEDEEFKQKQSGDPEKRKAEVALRLRAKHTEGEWILDSKSSCAAWNSSPQLDESLTWSGRCFDGMLYGKGTSQWFKNGKKTATIKGEYLEGILNGHGTKFWSNGDSYEGEFSDGSRTGHGVYKWASGDRYEGDWKDNLRHGYGVQSWVSLNQQYEGQWENDKPIHEE